MKIKLVLLSCFCVLINSMVFAQHQISEKEKQLFILCKIWGAVKYHHPDVTSGKHDMDAFLLRILDDLGNNNYGKTDFNRLMSNWFEELGPIESVNENHKTKDWFEKNFDIGWIDIEYLNEETKTYLSKLITGNVADRQHYVSVNRKVGNIEIINERVYEPDDLINNKISLLVFFRYWNIIEYFFPYKYLADKNWDDVLKEYIPIFEKIKDPRQFLVSFLELVVELDDSHANFFNQEILSFFGKKYIPVAFKIIDGKAVITNSFNDELAKENNLKEGDIILRADGKSIQSRINELSGYLHGSNRARKNYNYRYSVFNGSTDSIQLELLRGKDTIRQNVGRFFYKDFKYEPQELSKWEVLDENILYLRLWLINGKDMREITKLLKTSKSLIIDLRRYPKFNIHKRIVEVIKKDDSDYFKKIVPDLKHPGKYKFFDSQPSGAKGSYQFSGNVAVLVNEGTISYGEFLTMDLQSADNVVVVGTQTAGAVGYVSNFEVLKGLKTRFTGTGIFYPNLDSVQRSGVKIDFLVEKTIKGLVENRDEILESAIKVLSKNDSRKNLKISEGK
nr:S41 family peptidase [uncultured Allomuricauda sp.]